MSTRSFQILAASGGIIGAIALGIYYSTVLIPPQLLNGTATNLQALAIQAHDRIFLDAWLQGTGALLSVVFFNAIVYLGGVAKRFSGRMTMIASAVLLAVGLSEGTFTYAAGQAAILGHPDTAQVSTDLTTVFGHVFTTVPAPFIFLSLGVALLSSHLLPRIFAYLALTLGAAFEIVGFLGLFSALTATVDTISLVIQIGQELWVIAVAIALIISAIKTHEGDSIREQTSTETVLSAE